MPVELNGNENVLAETENFLVVAISDGGDTIYDIDFGIVTVHLTEDEYEEFIELITLLKK